MAGRTRIQIFCVLCLLYLLVGSGCGDGDFGSRLLVNQPDPDGQGGDAAGVDPVDTGIDSGRTDTVDTGFESDASGADTVEEAGIDSGRDDADTRSDTGPTFTNPCRTGLSYCGGDCVDTQTNADHCGMCGKSCGAGQTCRSRRCECVDGGHTICGNTCVDLRTNDDHCGRCNKSCGGGKVCKSRTCKEQSAVAAVIRETNRVRSTPTNCATTGEMSKAPPLKGDPELHKAAQKHADRMATKNFFGHDDPHDGTNFVARIRNTNFRGRPVGENIAAGYPSAAAAVRGWKTSKTGHCRNLMSQRANRIGVGFARGTRGSRYSTYWVQVFGRQ